VSSTDDLKLLASAWNLDLQALSDEEDWPQYEVLRHGETPFDGNVRALAVRQVGRYGNRFYQLLHAGVIARRLGCNEIFVDSDDMGDLPRTLGGIRFAHSDATRIDAAALAGVFFTYRGFESLLHPLDARFIQSTIETLVAPFFPAAPPDLGPDVVVLHFRGGDVFTRVDDWVPAHYVMPPAAFYTQAVEFARAQLGVTAVRIVFEDHSNPALAVVQNYCRRRGIPCHSQSASLEEDVSLMLGARHLVIPYGTFGEANALLSQRLRSLFAFRTLESHDWMYRRDRSLVEVVLQFARGVRTFVGHDRGTYIPPFGWRATADQVAMIRDYPAESLAIDEVLPPS